LNKKRTLNAFVIMPFGNNNEYKDGSEESDYVFNSIIKPGIEKAFEGEADVHLNIFREVDKNIPGSITSAIIKSIAKADIVVTDLTGRNSNVFPGTGHPILSEKPHISIGGTAWHSASL
jgi:hypothetical protein